jgi:bifunctional non-homologous end joining protein LigD
MNNITEYAENHRKGFKKPKSSIVERWNTRVVPRNLHNQGRAGAAAYLTAYGKGIAAPKVIELALCAEAMGSPAMAAGFWEKAFELETGNAVRFEAGDATASIPVSTERVRPAVSLSGLPDNMQPGKIVTMQPADTKLNRTAFILNPEYVGQPKRDGHHDVTLADEENAVHQSRSTSIMAPFSIAFDNAAKQVAAKLGAFVLDGERYYKSANGAEHRTAAQAAEENINLGKGEILPVTVYAIFKALYAGGKSLLEADEMERIEAARPIGEALIAVLKGADCEVEVLPTAITTAEKQDLADSQKASGREGEVWIRRTCRYTGGKSHKTDILRTKYFIEIRVRVTGLTKTTAAGRLFGAIEVADVKTGKSLGSVGTGFDAGTSKLLVDRFAAHPDNTFIEVRAQGYTEGGVLWQARLLEIVK